MACEEIEKVESALANCRDENANLSIGLAETCSRVERLEAENKQLRVGRTKLVEYGEQYRGKIIKLEAENKRLLEDLMEFGCHQAGCLAGYDDKKWKCDCGWERAKQEALSGGKD